MTQDTQSSFVRHEPCPSCNSRDNLARYSDGHAYCFGCEYREPAVGEVNVVEKMKQMNAVIGGEGNGGVIYPELHYGRDSLVGIALILSYLAERKISLSELRKEYTDYKVSKNKIELSDDMNVNAIYEKVKNEFKQYQILTIDGVKIDFPDGWVHLRTSNTEPIMRVYAESTTDEQAQKYADKIIDLVNSM